MTKSEKEYKEFIDDITVAVQCGIITESGEPSGFDTTHAVDAIIDVLIQHQLIIVLNEEEQN